MKLLLAGVARDFTEVFEKSCRVIFPLFRRVKFMKKYQHSDLRGGKRGRGSLSESHIDSDFPLDLNFKCKNFINTLAARLVSATDTLIFIIELSVESF